MDIFYSERQNPLIFLGVFKKTFAFFSHRCIISTIINNNMDTDEQAKRDIIFMLMELSEDKDFLTKVNKLTFGLLSGRDTDVRQ